MKTYITNQNRESMAVQQESLCHGLEKRIESAQSKGNLTLLAQLEQEASQLGCELPAFTQTEPAQS